MSEYQYYEFLALDNPLTPQQTSYLRTLSSRAQITPVSFTNEYNWGDFKGNPNELMKLFFDAHIYVANWGTAIFMLRVPLDAIPTEIAEAFELDNFISFDKTKDHWVITWRLDESENYERFGLETGSGWMVRLSPIRDELLRNDFRSLYIGWLAAVTWEQVEESNLEPLPLSGLDNPTAAQQALVKFLEVDEDLVAGAGIVRPKMIIKEPSQHEIEDWLKNLPQDEISSIMMQLLKGQGIQAERTLKKQFYTWQHRLQNNKEQLPPLSVAEIKKNAEIAKEKRLERYKLQQQKLEKKRQEKRKAYLISLANDLPNAWQRVQQIIERGSGQAYDEACQLIVDISEACSFDTGKDSFNLQLNKNIPDLMRRKALMQRLEKVGLRHNG